MADPTGPYRWTLMLSRRSYDPFSSLLFPFPVALSVGGRRRGEVRGRLHDDRLDLLIDRERKMQRLRDALNVALVERGEVLHHQAQTLRHRLREADREPRVELPARLQPRRLRELRRPARRGAAAAALRRRADAPRRS